ncbi:hypothetical protein JHN63_32640 [Streptomyces sp. MBT65]|uniref:hypothetical protein n=1 Tax=Streptomyces sp. MBT65 TaxID=1488395 RepID=UPI00190DB59C|nr:hypothetical protein [Streptomyces sp. MBT65]MBK3578468.1 hypothetical protein [Streptomyces sp. MBT65]
MSWSMFVFRDHWADAHDRQQAAFMAFSTLYAEAAPAYRETEWLRHWQSSWPEIADTQANGLSDLNPEEHLTDDERVAWFREFLHDYRLWVASTADTIRLLTGYEPDNLIAFAMTMEAVIAGDVSHPNVRRRTHVTRDTS